MALSMQDYGNSNVYRIDYTLGGGKERAYVEAPNIERAVECLVLLGEEPNGEFDIKRVKKLCNLTWAMRWDDPRIRALSIEPEIVS